MISALVHEVPALYMAFMDDQRQATGESHFVRDSGRYPLCGRGDVNTYSIFAESMRLVISLIGRLGCIVPSGIATDDTTKWFFRDLIETQTLSSLYSFENEEHIFANVHNETKFCLLTISGINKLNSEADFVFFARQTSSLQDANRHFPLSFADIALLNPNTRTCPIFRSKHDKELAKGIYERVPVFLKEGSPDVNHWDVSFLTMFHMSNDSHLFRTREQLEKDGWKFTGNIFHKNGEQCLPLYEGKMVWHFDHRFGTYEGQTQAQANKGNLPLLDEQQHADPLLYALSKYWIHESHFSVLLNDQQKAFLVFRDVTNAVVLRTAIFSTLPIVPCGHKIPAVILGSKNSKDMLCLGAGFSSFIFDYVTRQKLGGTSLSYFILKQLPVLPPDQYKLQCSWDNIYSLGDWIAPRALELTYTAWDLEAFAQDCGYDGPPFRWGEERRFLLRCELDAAYFLLYEIARDDVAYIMDTFRVWKEKEEKRFGEYRTKRVILEIYDEMTQAIESGQAYRTRLEPGPADPAVAHEPRLEDRLVAD